MCICRHPISIRGLWLRSWTRFWSFGSLIFGRNWWMIGFQLWCARRAGSRSAPLPASGTGSRDRRSPDAGTLGRCAGDSCRCDRLSTTLDDRRLWGTNRLMGNRRCCWHHLSVTRLQALHVHVLRQTETSRIRNSVRRFDLTGKKLPQFRISRC